MEGTPGLNTYAERVNARMNELLPPAGKVPQALHEAMRYSALAPGKRLRPALCMESARAVGADPFSVLDAACAIEFVHAFSLIHDDLPALDNDDIRRGMPTCHAKFGEAVAILAGDALFALAFQTLASVPNSGVAVGRLASAAIALVQGETLDLLSEGTTPSHETVEFIHVHKTGFLLAAACQIGGGLGGGSKDEVLQLWEFGTHLGFAFQITDDVLNETASAEQLGKAGGSDRARGKMTYPSVFGLEESVARANHASEMAIKSLTNLPGPTEFLAELARFAVNRVN